MKRRVLILVSYSCVLGVMFLVSQRYLSLERLVAEEVRLRSVLDQHPLSGWWIVFAAYLGLSLIPGTTGKAIIVGWLYGFWSALVLVNVGLTIAAMLTFWVSHYFFRSAIQKRFAVQVERVDQTIERSGAYYLFAARVLHAPYCLTNYLMGATRMRTSSFWWSTQLGLLPSNILFVYAGNQLPTLKQVVDQGVSALLSPGLLVALVALSVLPLLVRPILRSSWRMYRREAGR